MKKAPTKYYKCLIYLARLEGFEPPTYGLEDPFEGFPQLPDLTQLSYIP